VCVDNARVANTVTNLREQRRRDRPERSRIAPRRGVNPTLPESNVRKAGRLEKHENVFTNDFPKRTKS
jgi:hypothetical protein